MRLNSIKAHIPIFDTSPPVVLVRNASVKGAVVVFMTVITLKCNNISLNNSQGHPGKEGPSGEKGHMVSFISFSTFPLWCFHLFFPELISASPCFSCFLLSCLRYICIRYICIHGDSSAVMHVWTVIACLIHALIKNLSPQGPAGPQGPIGYPGPRGVKVG